MLKIFRGLFLGLVVLVGSTCVTPTHVSSAFSEPKSTVILTYVQASGLSGARDEAIVLFNPTNQEVDVTEWCLINKAQVEFACLVPNTQNSKLFLPAKTHAVFVSTTYAARVGGVVEDAIIFEPTHATSGSITGNADTIKLLNAAKDTIAEFSWNTTIASGKAYFRMQNSTDPPEYASTNMAADWGVGPMLEAVPYNELIEREVVVIPEEESVEKIHPLINELLPNATGLDTGFEFIELYNPNLTQEVDLAPYTLLVSNKSYAFPPQARLAPGELRAFYNNEIRFTLPNTTGYAQLLFNGAPIGESIDYSAPEEGRAWALIEDEWRYVDTPTPNAENKQTSVVDSVDTAVTLLEVQPKSCPAGQYRSSETNRCRKILVESSQAACKPGQQRNETTGRCRNVAVAGVQTACKEGQERNPETNRCRNSTKMTNAPHGLGEVKQENSQGVSWYMWVAIIGIILAVVGYGAWEWRREIVQLWQRMRRNIGRKSE